MKKLILLVCVAIFSFAFTQQTPVKAPTVDEFNLIYTSMIKAIKNVKNTKFKMVKNERFDEEIVKSVQMCKMQVTPRKIYMNILEGPNNGTKILYVEGENDNEAYADAKSWLPTVSINPRGSLARTKQRHTMFELGFKYTGDVIINSYEKFKNQLAAGETANPKAFKYYGIIKWAGRDVHKIMLNDLHYKLVDYTVKEGEDLEKIARKLSLDEYSLLEHNEDVDDYDDVKAGQVIKVPTTFAKKVIMCIDAKTFLPVYQKLYDLKGMIGEYAYHNIGINNVKPEEFTKDYSEYGF